MIYEVEAFQKMFEENDLAQCYEKLDYSRGIVEVMEKARKEAEWMEEGRTGMLVGAGLGAIAGGALGSKFDK